MKLFISPHNDDETLFGAFTLLREKPLVLVVTDSYIQFERGDGITAEDRRTETDNAMQVLGCQWESGGIADTEISEDVVRTLFRHLSNKYFLETVYAPKFYGNGNPHHDLIGKVAKEVFGNKVTAYATYTKNNLYMTGETVVMPTEEELDLKTKALQCYKSQLSLASTRPHFEAVLGKGEWYD